MNAAAKTAKTAKTRTAKPAKSEQTAQVEQKFDNVILQALQTRDAKLRALGLTNQVQQLKTAISAASDNMVKAAREVLTQTDFDALAARIAECDDNGKGREQVKTIVKIVNTMGAIVVGLQSQLDNNTRLGVATLLHMGNHANIRELMYAQSRVALNAGNTYGVRTEVFKNFANYSTGTASSQTAQVRQVLNVFGFFDGFVKGGRDNDPHLNEYALNMLARLK